MRLSGKTDTKNNAAEGAEITDIQNYATLAK
jgi:hypothetical protein